MAKKFKGTKTGSSIQLVKVKHGKEHNSETRSERPVLKNEKADQLLRLVASLIVQNLLKEASSDR